MAPSISSGHALPETPPLHGTHTARGQAGISVTVWARHAVGLRGLNFKEFFEWLSKSVSRVSRSPPGDTVKLDLEGLAGTCRAELEST